MAQQEYEYRSNPSNYWAKWLDAPDQLQREEVIGRLPIAKSSLAASTILNSYFEDLAEHLGVKLK